jgi:hypothetical protein
MSRNRSRRGRRKNDEYEREMHRRWSKFHDGICPHCFQEIPKFSTTDRGNSGIHLTGGCLTMAYSIMVEILVSEVEWKLVKEYELNLVAIAVDACKDAIQSRSLMHHAVAAATSRNAEMITLKAENERLKGALQERRLPTTEITVMKTTPSTTTEAAITKTAMKMIIPSRKPIILDDLYE